MSLTNKLIGIPKKFLATASVAVPLAFGSVYGCGDSEETRRILSTYESIAEQMCNCRDSQCLDSLNKQYSEMYHAIGNASSSASSDEIRGRFLRASGKFGSCSNELRHGKARTYLTKVKRTVKTTSATHKKCGPSLTKGDGYHGKWDDNCNGKWRLIDKNGVLQRLSIYEHGKQVKNTAYWPDGTIQGQFNRTDNGDEYTTWFDRKGRLHGEQRPAFTLVDPNNYRVVQMEFRHGELKKIEWFNRWKRNPLKQNPLEYLVQDGLLKRQDIPRHKSPIASKTSPSGRGSSLADKVIDRGIDAVTPESKGATRDMQKAAVKFVLDPSNERSEGHLKDLMDSTRRAAEE